MLSQCSLLSAIRDFYPELSSRFGMKPTELLENKLLRYFSSFSAMDVRTKLHYLNVLPSSHPEWIEFVENITVHETFFFRDERQINFLNDVLIPELFDDSIRGQRKSITICSAGCSTGAEAYTLAILLLSNLLKLQLASGSPDGSVTLSTDISAKVLGLDVSKAVIEQARKAEYYDVTLGDFRDMPGQWRSWFDKKAQNAMDTPCLQPKSFVRCITNFQVHNLMDPIIYPGSFDLVVCRNVLIYFDDEHKRTIQQHLLNGLRPGGLMVMGAVDPLLVLGDGVKSLSKEGNFYYKKC